MKANVLRPIAVWCLLACSGLVWAEMATPANKPFEPASRMSHYAATFQVAEDGASVEEREWSLRVVKARAVARAKQASVSYSTRAQTVEVLKAYTLKADGRRIEVPKDQHKTASNRDTDPAAALLLERTTLTVEFPEVAVGDTVVFAYRLSAKEPLFAGQVSINERFSKYEAYDDVKIKVDAPIALWNSYQVSELREVQKVAKDGRKIIEWAWDNKDPQPSKRKNFSVHDVEQDPGFALSSFKRHADIAKVYGEKAKPMVVVNARVKKLAKEIVKNKTAPRAVARALYEWVALNIAYVPQGIELGSVAPRSLDVILDSRMGDAKDHATLLQALLSAKGITSTQALINSGSGYRLSTVPVVASVNHVINYISSLQLFLDSTSQATPFGMLPFADEDKPVLLVDGHQEGLKTPIQPIGANQQTMTTKVRISEDGSAKGEVKVALKGLFAVNAREKMRNVLPEQESELVFNYFFGGGYEGRGTFTKENTKVLRDTFGYATQFEVKGMFPKVGEGTFTIHPMFYSESPVADYLEAATLPVEEHAEVTCASGRSIEEYTLELPARMTVVSLPKDVKLESEFLSYSASYQLKSTTLTVKRVFDDRSKGNVCSPAVAKAYQQFAQQAAPDAKAQVVIK